MASFSTFLTRTLGWPKKSSDVGFDDLTFNMKDLKSHVLLILDNFSGHFVEDLYTPTNVKLCFLPPNATSVLQPLDGGIIRTLNAAAGNYISHNGISLIYLYRPKHLAIFRRLQIEKVYFRLNSRTPTPANAIYKVDQLQAMKWCR